MPGGVVELVLDGRSPLVSDHDIVAWVEGAARAIAGYYGTFPVENVVLTVHGGGPGRISSGRTVGVRPGAARIGISVGNAATPSDLKANWELVHEMVHLAFPSMTGKPWIEEGLATYVEPIVRARAGLAPGADIWKWLVWGLPKGQASLSGGLDGARTWAATYWGGALFCFDADLAIRRRTGGRKSLDDALRAIVRAGGNVTVSWDLERALDVGDRAVGAPVLRELYARMADTPPRDDLDATFRELGVRAAGDGVAYDDSAPLAAIRRAITTAK